MNGAEIDGEYRYRLWRQMPEPLGDADPRTCLWVMLNPSTADGTEDDATIRRCLSFADREGCTRIEVVNLFAYRATNPDALLKVRDPEGPRNRDVLRDRLSTAVAEDWLVICAWGLWPGKSGRPFHLDVGAEAHRLGLTLRSLGRNPDHSPKHPLRLASWTPLEIWP